MKEGLYFIAILPPDDIAEKVQSVKKEFAEKFNSSEAYRRPAHITLQAPFKIPEQEEAELIKSLKSFAKKQTSFPIQLDGFNHFRDDVIYIDVENPAPIQSLYQKLIEFLQSECGFTDKMIRGKSITPHMTVAYRDLSSEQFQEAWPDFSPRSFDYSFEVNSMVLLKHDSKQWRPHHEFYFNPPSR